MQGEQTQVMTRAERRRAVEEQARSSRSRRRRAAAPTPVVAPPPSPTTATAVAVLERPPVVLGTAAADGRASRTGRRVADRARRGRRRRTAAAVAVVAVLGVAGCGAVAWAGMLPGDVEQLVLRVAGSPEEVAPAAADPAPTVAVTPSASLTETADERLLSTVDLCGALSRGELDPTSASYRTLVVAAGSADLDAWCADLTGDAARADS
ncbi:hypothetical protein [Phycicoccus sonneratiae]|uniref:Uncharacterized protein n=1 Tax=Phycicoccus sonneratiae TaxID=2807628 RepID=A0ABS2CHD1_9MICO|nr:hypothetical protein [Phycicoccus sonneraticus]MBM6399287.1 hypothetical protein [Phycicoccus sonneraticus]